MKKHVVSRQPLARVLELEVKDLQFGYDDSAPSWRPPPVLRGNWARASKVDPWGPCYTHDVELVKSLLQACTQVAPLVSAPVSIFICLWDGLERVNGWAYESVAHYQKPPRWWKGPGDKPWEGTIVLSGKRTEIHPAVTRYVTPHEYGHIVEDALSRLRYGMDGGSKLMDEFGKLRGLKRGLTYGSGTHHLMPGEVFANDFRAYVMESEREFWPHLCAPAWKDKRAARWWDAAVRELQEASR